MKCVDESINVVPENIVVSIKKKKSCEPLTLDDIEPYHGYNSETDEPCIHCWRTYVFVDIVQIPKDKSSDGTGFVKIVTCECGRVINGAECRDVLNVVDKDGTHGRVALGLGVLSKTMENDYNGEIVQIEGLKICRK